MEGDSSKGINPLIQSPEGEVSTVSHPLSSLPPMRHKKITKAPLHYQLAHPLTPGLWSVGINVNLILCIKF